MVLRCERAHLSWSMPDVGSSHDRQDTEPEAWLPALSGGGQTIPERRSIVVPVKAPSGAANGLAGRLGRPKPISWPD